MRWRRTVGFIDELLTSPGVHDAPLVLGAAARLLMATALMVFPTTEAPARGEPEVRPSTLRRAIAFIESSPDLDIGVGDIARAAHVTPRAVQLAFHKHLQTTPIAYVRRVRLDHAHRELLAASPGDGTTVTTVAYRWGFSSPGRFGQLHRAEYGVAPSVILRRRGS